MTYELGDIVEFNNDEDIKLVGMIIDSKLNMLFTVLSSGYVVNVISPDKIIRKDNDLKIEITDYDVCKAIELLSNFNDAKNNAWSAILLGSNVIPEDSLYLFDRYVLIEAIKNYDKYDLQIIAALPKMSNQKQLIKELTDLLELKRKSL